MSQIPVFIFGDSQIGKTTCLKEFARRNNHGTTKYLELPTAATLSTVKREVAKACYIGAKISEHELNERIPKAITGNMLIIVDEFHRPFKTSNRYQAVRIAEWLRELYDKTKCGMVFSATNIGLEELETGPSSLVLEQFRRRGMMQLILPPTPPRADVNKFAKAFGLPPPDGEALEVIGAILKRSGLNQYVLFLQSAANLAANQNKPVSWDHFLVAHDKIQSLSKG